METPICECCFPIHGGEDCKATTVDDQGRKVCVFCCDGVPCPGQKRIRKLAATPQVVKRNKEAAKVTITVSKGQQVDPVHVEARTCKVAGCNEVLGSRNRSGLCGKHRHHGDPRRNSSRAHNAANGSSTHAKKNGSVPPPTPDPRVAERVDRFLADLPLQDKVQLCQAWLTGRI